MNTLILYNYFRSSTSYRARIALNLKNLPYQYKPVHLLNNGGEQNQPEYRKINPLGGLPTLIDGDKVISQTVAIIEYLDEAFPQTYQLLPKDPYPRAKIRQVCENINSDVHPYQNSKVTNYLEKVCGFTPEQKQDWYIKWVHDGLEATEKIVAQSAKTYSFGEEITAADLFIVPQLFSADRFKIDITKYPTLYRVNLSCLKLEAFQKAHPFHQIDTPPKT